MCDCAGLQALHAGFIEEMLPAAPGGEETGEGVQEHCSATPPELMEAQSWGRALGSAGVGAWKREGHKPQHNRAEVLWGGFEAWAGGIDGFLEAVQADDSLHQTGRAGGLGHDPQARTRLTQALERGFQHSGASAVWSSHLCGSACVNRLTPASSRLTVTQSIRDIRKPEVGML